MPTDRQLILQRRLRLIAFATATVASGQLQADEREPARPVAGDAGKIGDAGLDAGSDASAHDAGQACPDGDQSSDSECTPEPCLCAAVPAATTGAPTLDLTGWFSSRR